MPYIPQTQKEREEILSAIGIRRFEDLVGNIPQEALFKARGGRILQEKPLSEMEVLSHVGALAAKNRTAAQMPSFLGAGAYRHFIPSAVGAMISRGEFLTAYTPYQPEASQGTLQATFEFQSMIAALFGMDAANASLYDGGSALAEAALLAVRETGRSKILVSRAVHPEYRRVLKTSCAHFEIVELPLDREGRTDAGAMEKETDANAACLILQSPNFLGLVEEGAAAGRIAHKQGALLVVSANPVSLGLLAPPGDTGADVAVAEGQPLGIPLQYGGPYLGLFACKEKYLRKMPGRIVGMTKDLEGRRGFVLTLQTREQHIRRERATSNICTNEALMALAATVHLSMLGPRGARELAELNLQKAHYAQSEILKLGGFSPLFEAPFFNEFAVRSKKDPDRINAALLEEGIIGGLALGPFYPELSDALLFCVTEMNTKAEIDRLVQALGRMQQ